MNRRGLRNVYIHTERYNPTIDPIINTKRFSDSLANLNKLRKRQQQHLAEGIDQVERAKIRKATHRVIPHRAEYLFYMNGHSARLNRRSMFSSDEIRQLQYNPPAENIRLFYGRGVGMSQQRPVSKAVERFHEDLKQQLDKSDRIIEELEFHHTNQIQTPDTPLLPSPSLYHTGKDSVISGIHGRKAIFITEESKEDIESETIPT